MKQKLHVALITLVMCVLGLVDVNAQTTLIDYPTAKDGINLYGGAQYGTIKINANKTTVDGIKLSSSGIKNSKLNQWISIKPEGGFKAGDVISIAGAYNNSSTKTATVDLISGDGKLTTLKSYTFINSRTETASPVAEDYTVTADADSLLIGRTGNTSTFITTLKVVRPGVSMPVLTLSPSSLDLDVLAATENHTATGTFTISGKNLTAGTYSLTVPTVEGLTVAPTSFTVAADGTVNQDVTVTYAPTADAEATSAEITATVGDLTKTVTINYSATLSEVEQRTISEATTWDFSKTGLEADIDYSKDDTNKNITFLYANLGAKTTADFAADALTFQGSYPLRKGNMAQDGVLSFKTSVAGVITVDFSDTGSKASATATKRYLVINGVQTEYYTMRNGKNDEKTSLPIFVPAGDVTITGSGSQCYYKVTFTPQENETIVITPARYATHVTEGLAVDFSKLSDGCVAYKAKYANSTITLTKIDAPVPAGTPIVIKVSQEVTLESAESATSLTDNELVAALAPVTADGTQWVLAYGSNGVGFYKVTPKTNIPAGRAYLVIPTETTASANFLSINDGETTGINGINVNEESLKNQPVYNLAGQRVGNSYKGVVIVNGKKVVR